MFVHEIRITLRDTDAAGIVFFARYFDLAHVAYEAFLEAHGMPLGEMIGAMPYLLPIVQANTEYRQPLRMDEHVRVEVTAEEVRTRSFTLRYRLVKRDGTVAATVRTTHAAIERATWKSTPLPERLRAALHSGKNDPGSSNNPPGTAA